MIKHILVSTNPPRRDARCAFQKSASHIVMDVEFGEGEGQISLKEAKKSAEEQKPKKEI